jgi:hypothetical protein
MEFYNNNIQISKKVIEDIFKNTNNETKMLVFGLGYDSKMWYNNNKNTYFIEDKQEYIDLNNNDIPSSNIIKYTYNNISVAKSFIISDEEIEKYIIPKEIKELGKFDIILIDGPEGYDIKRTGRLIPYYWSSLLSKKGSLIYCDDSSRPLENMCINKYFKDNNKTIFNERLGCTKIFV